MDVDYILQFGFVSGNCDDQSVDDPSTCWRIAPMLDYRRVLADNVKAARKALDLSQEALALEAEIDRTYVSGIERGRRNPSVTMIAKLAGRLKTTPAALLTPRIIDESGDSNGG